MKVNFKKRITKKEKLFEAEDFLALAGKLKVKVRKNQSALKAREYMEKHYKRV